jgi:hypothetical protein
MQLFKIDNFKRSHSREAFPVFHHLSDEEISVIRSRLKKSFGSETDSGKSLLMTIHSRAVSIPQHNALDDDFNLANAIADAGIEPASDVFISWDSLHDIDRFQFNDCVRYFDDLWYPSSDDIELFDETGHWVMLVAHDGYIGVCKSDTK